MAEKHFFDLFKHKLNTLTPDEQHRGDDWIALGDRLNSVLPQRPRGPRRSIVLPFILLAAFLSSNAAWWQSSRRDQDSLKHLKSQMEQLQTRIATWQTTAGPVHPNIIHDTIWRTVYVQVNEKLPAFSEKLESEMAKTVHHIPSKPLKTTNTTFSIELSADITSPVNGAEIRSRPADHTVSEIATNTNNTSPYHTECCTLSSKSPALLKIRKTETTLPKSLTVNTLASDHNLPIAVRPTPKLKPRFYSIGVGAGWLLAASEGLMHEGGLSYRLNGEIGLTRHWGVTASYGAGRIHYKAHDPAAIIGAPVLPVSGVGHHLVDMDVTGQRIRQLDLGTRYTFAQPGKPRPFLGLSWTNQAILPFTIEYEVLHEQSGIIQKAVFEVTNTQRQNNIIGFNAGLSLPLTTGFYLSMDGFYQRQWKKPSRLTPDMTGVRASVNWLF